MLVALLMTEIEKSSGLLTIVYLVMADPPLFVGGVQETFAARLAPPDAVTPNGAFGTPTGTTSREGSDFSPIPVTFIASTTKL